MEAYKSISLFVIGVVIFACCAEAAIPMQSRRVTCEEPLTGKRYALGQTWYTNAARQCMVLTCDGENSISGLTCATFKVPSWCTVKPGDPEAVYPGCCPTPVCPEDNAIEGSSGPSSGPSSSGAHESGFGDLDGVDGFGGYPYPPAL